MKKRWICNELPNDAAAEKLAAQLSIEKPLAALLIQRGINTPEAAEEFFNPDISKLHNPFLMKDMDKAVKRLSDAIIDNQKILVYGDYDVDGTSAVALLYSFLCEIIGADSKNLVEYYIPDRYSEGYGISDQGVEYCRDNNVNLLISLDCGIKANDKVEMANKYGIDVIVCDHHLEGDELPPAVAILDPKRKDCPYPYKELSGCGVGFKLIQGYCQKYKLPDQLWLSRMDLVAISIASDIVAITGENRILAHFGLEIINKFPRVGIKSILDQAGIKLHYPFKEETIFSRVISISDLVFYVGPRINAAGRMKSGRESVRLFIFEDEDKSVDIAKRINTQNEERKEQDRNATEEAIHTIRTSHEYVNRKSIVIYNPNWFKGIIGIVASRLVEVFYKPTIVLTKSSDGLITGSARSVKEFNIYDGIDYCSDLLEHFGGHKFAAGLSMKEENLEEFIEKFEQYVSDNLEESSFVPEISVDMPLDLSEITHSFLNNLKRFAPFGPGNMEPIFQSNNVVDEGAARIVGDKHLKARVQYPDRPVRPIDVIAFNQKDKLEMIKDNKTFDVLYHVEENVWNNVVNIQLNVKDIRPSNSNE
ncbi:MAG: single-stranded-DNA-specific exonuclease RecJ [Bacteroidales bacterium]|jgi:single-stranded-DNA-specific exonuclease|nr:single-stranded-DNA-specific exonuclease RecJ [Bacteroidales bacterium]MBR3572167.1 single-stranded-DNA-specific exonuclease RecJ [Bacteroidales bacterium]